jgi:hypothetical protein
MMNNRKIWIFGLLLLGLVLVPAVYATQPTRFDDGWWGNTVYDGAGNVSFDFVIDSIGLSGTGTQPEVVPGRVAHGTFVGTLNNGPEGECEYTVATFSMPNGEIKEPFRANMNRCSGGLEGLHMIGKGWIDWSLFPALFEGPWVGAYHIDP